MSNSFPKFAKESPDIPLNYQTNNVQDIIKQEEIYHCNSKE